MSAELDPLSQALANAVRLRRDTGDDAPVLAALQVIVDQCCAQLRGVQDAAIADADHALRRYQQAQATRDPAQIAQAHRHSQAAIAHANKTTADVVVALEALLTGTMDLTSPALARLQRAVDATQALLEQADHKTAPTSAAGSDTTLPHAGGRP